MADATRTVTPFALQPTMASAWARAAIGVAGPVLERALGLHALGRMYAQTTGTSVVDDFPERALAALGIDWSVTDAGLARIPSAGPLVVVANHPFGAADGLALLALVRRVRRDVRLLGNYLLQRIPELAELVIAVDPFGGPDARAGNARMLRRATDWVRRGGVLLVFPAGEVSATRAPDGRLIDRPWRRGVARIVAAAEADVLPVCFEGRNSGVFEAVGRLHPGLRTALLPRELIRRRGMAVRPIVGRVIPHAELAGLDESVVTNVLRARTYGLLQAPRPAEPPHARRPGATPAAHVEDPDGIAVEVARLPTTRVLATSGELQAMWAEVEEVPTLLREIGRLREITFRSVGEGTGTARDLDRFDRDYVHLFVWHQRRREVVGAYRLGLTDRILARRGLRGLYTRTLFRYGRPLVDALGPAIELGRSFVRAEYQRDYAPLLLLWQGISRFAAQHPRYRRLFGPVSISADYPPAARDLIVSALEASSLESSWAGLARPRRPYRSLTGVATDELTGGCASAHALIRDMPQALPGLPVLLRHYLKLGATPLAVSVDPAFGNAVDALMVVDLDLVPPALLARYMGAGALAAFGAGRAA
jgi:putative hemolysin